MCNYCEIAKHNEYEKSSFCPVCGSFIGDKRVELKDIPIGENFILDHEEFIVLAQYEKSTFVITQFDTQEVMEFDNLYKYRSDKANFVGSTVQMHIDYWLKKHKKLNDAVLDRKLRLDDHNYPVVHGRLLTLNGYKKYKDIIDEKKKGVRILLADGPDGIYGNRISILGDNHELVVIPSTALRVHLVSPTLYLNPEVKVIPVNN